jgi:hypothetical protein
MPGGRARRRVVEDKGERGLPDPKAILFLIGTDGLQDREACGAVRVQQPEPDLTCGCGESVQRQRLAVR